jgi:(4-(4-[2-(gamma-L-glutamylamino)ethyl]phenoxymethyl)furan-2-yl)methanamine synthase
MHPEAVIGWDLGGAHVKAARLDSSGRVERVVQIPCPLWRGLTELDRALDAAESLLGSAPTHAVTMTGEMVDLFATRAEGVARLVAAMRHRFTGLRFYAGDAGLVSPEETASAGLRLASANWMASAALMAARLPDGLLIDVGSTTTDLVPVRDGRVRAHGRDDARRLEARELVYTGVVRTPVMAMAAEVPFDGRSVPLMAEFFATAADVHRLCGRLPLGADSYPAADGGDKTEAGSARRLARMIGRDADALPLDGWRGLARWLAEAQARRIEDACAVVLAREPLPADAPLVAAGVGRFLVADLAVRLGRRYLDFASLLPEPGREPELVSNCAPAVAVAWLSQGRAAAGPPLD